MEDARLHSDAAAAAAAAKPAKEVLWDLQKGNTRFWMGVSSRPEISAFERRALIIQQFPSVAVLGCSDSRVPIEIVFDQGTLQLHYTVHYTVHYRNTLSRRHLVITRGRLGEFHVPAVTRTRSEVPTSLSFPVGGELPLCQLC